LSVPDFSTLRLAGGTALAMQYGHRKSVDLDLFGKWIVDGFVISSVIQPFGEVIILQNHPAIKSFSIQGIKVDIVNYPYPWIGDVITDDNLRLASSKDIAAMKLAAVTGRGSRKDFIDLYFLLKQYTLNELLKFYEEKFADGSVFMVLKSLIYFDEADEDVDPVPLKPFDWNEVKSAILLSHRDYMDGLMK
jgi:hypothetical protein